MKKFFVFAVLVLVNFPVVIADDNNMEIPGIVGIDLDEESEDAPHIWSLAF